MRERDFSIIRTAAALAIAIACVVLPASAGAASNASFDDPIGDSTYYAADLGATTVAVGDDDTVNVDTRIVPRPPAYWGGCAYTVGAFPYQTCVPANMNVTWYLDFSANGGSVADDGADAKVTAIPSRDPDVLGKQPLGRRQRQVLPPARSPPRARMRAARTGRCASQTSGSRGQRRCASGSCPSTSPTTASALF